MGSLCIILQKNRKQLLRSVYVYVAYWTFLIFGRGKNASDGIIWRTPCSTSADPLGVADPRLKTSALKALSLLLLTQIYSYQLTDVLLISRFTFEFILVIIFAIILEHKISLSHTHTNLLVSKMCVVFNESTSGQI